MHKSFFDLKIEQKNEFAMGTGLKHGYLAYKREK